MLRSKTRKIILTIGLAVFAIVGWCAYALFAMPNIQPHVGDGQFANHSWRFPWRSVGIPVPGYTIKFDDLDLSDRVEALYRVEQLPEIGRMAGVYLCVDDPGRKFWTDESRAKLSAILEIDVVDEDGNSVCHFSQPLAKMYWAFPEGGRDTYGLYSSEESSFVSRSNEGYRIRVRYSPDPQLDGFKGFLWIRCGGSI